MAFKKIEPKMNFFPRPTTKGNWNCSECGIGITELPFDPATDRPIYCRECLVKRSVKKFQR